MFRSYATGTATLAGLAIWLNDSGFRTRNTKKLLGPDGVLVSGPRLFTTASIRGILHNPFYAGLVKHREEVHQGSHEGLVSRETFDLVQVTLRKNSGRSRTLAPRPEREYLLKGIIRCAYCLMPMWRTQLHKCATTSPDSSARPDHSSLGGDPCLITPALSLKSSAVSRPIPLGITTIPFGVTRWRVPSQTVTTGQPTAAPSM